MICWLSSFVPSVELEYVWSFNQDEILERYKIKEKFDPLIRLFGEKSDKKKKRRWWKRREVTEEESKEGLDKLLKIGERGGNR